MKNQYREYAVDLNTTETIGANIDGTYKAILGDEAGWAGLFVSPFSTVGIAALGYGIMTTDDVQLGNINDLLDKTSIDPLNRDLYNDTDAIPTVSWNFLQLGDGTSLSVSWGGISGRTLWSSNGNQAMDWENRVLYADDGATELVNWVADGVDFNPNGTYKATIGNDTASKAGYF
ncbi:MAG: hypothetical protein H7836_18330, partial [Magnetococcus sp. YQC-3]